jgi:N-acyl-D-amino-acid deacylase
MKYLVLLLIIPFASVAQQYDVLITGGKIIDGTGNSWFNADIGIKEGKIAIIGKLTAATANRIIHADGLVVSPGFIDVHAHVEGSIFEKPTADNFIYDGVTTLVTGNCGGSYQYGIGKFLERIDSIHPSLNIASLVGHNTIREAVMQRAFRDPAPEEQQQMDSMVAIAMREGAVGMSTGLIYIPGTYSKTAEIKSLAAVAANYSGVYASHMRNEGSDVNDAIRETIEIGRSAGIPVQISHFKVTGKKNWGNSINTLELVKAARKEGLDVTIDQYPYTASSTNLHVLLPSWVMSGGQDSVIERLSNIVSREKIVKEIIAAAKKDRRKNFSYAVVANCPADSTLNGKTISEITRLSGRKPGLKNDIETVFGIIIKGGAQMIYHSMSEKDVSYIMQYPFNMTASDAGVVYLPRSVPHPRAYGTNARVLALYVRQKNIISLEEAIRRMTSLPAQKFRLTNRGLIKPGMAADLIIFDPETVQDRSTFEKPHAFSDGFKYVLVNGAITIDEYKHTMARNGQAIIQHP